MNFVLFKLLEESKAFVLGFALGFAAKWLEAFVRSRFNRSEKLDESIAKLLDAYKDAVAQHYDAWANHQQGNWTDSNEKSRNAIDALAKANKRARQDLCAHLTSAAAEQLERKWMEYFHGLTGNLGLIHRKSDKILDLSHLEELYRVHMAYCADLRAAIFKGKAVK